MLKFHIMEKEHESVLWGFSDYKLVSVGLCLDFAVKWLHDMQYIYVHVLVIWYLFRQR